MIELKFGLYKVRPFFSVIETVNETVIAFNFCSNRKMDKLYTSQIRIPATLLELSHVILLKTRYVEAPRLKLIFQNNSKWFRNFSTKNF